MQPADLIIHARWLLTCEPEYNVFENHALVIKDGLILDILPSQSASEKYTPSDAQHFPHHMLMPGFVNTHTHLAMNLFRGLADDMGLMEWLNTHIWPAESAWVSHQFVYDASMLAMAEMIRGGTTCFNDMYFFLQASAAAAADAGLRANIGITVIGVPTAWAKTPAEYIAKGLEFYYEYKNHPLIKTTFAPHSIYTVSDAQLIEVRDLAQEHDLKINMHVQETMDEVTQSLKETNLRPLRRLHNLGLVTPRLIAVHMTQVVDDDLEILAAHKPNIVHCPESNMKLASGICPIHEFKKMGVNVALGTDGAASNNDLNMIAEMRSAAFLSKVSTGDSSATHSYEVMKMATHNGAKALGLDAIIGTLTAGKAADFIAIDLDRIETLPVYHPTSSLVYAAAREQVTDVWVAGRQLMKNRQLTTIDEAAVKAKAAEWQHKIKANAAQVPLKP